MQSSTRLLLAGLAASLLATGGFRLAAARAQEAAPPKEEEKAKAPDSGELESLVKSLGDPDFAVREKAHARLREAGDAARRALETGSHSRDPQVKWSSRRLLRLLREDRVERPKSLLEFGPGEEEREPSPSESEWEIPGFDADAFQAHMEALREKMREMERRFRDMSARLPRLEWHGAVPREGGVERHVVVERDGERTEVRVGADGRVKVDLRRTVDGKAVEETTEAASVEALEKEHPEVYAKVKDLLGDVSGIRVFMGPSVLPPQPGLQFRDGNLRLRGLLDPDRGESTPVLGVTVSEVPDVLRAHASLGPDEGVVVEEVLEKTPAARLGLRRHDVILSVNGIPVSSADDVRAAVKAVKEGGELRLRVLRAGQRTDLAGTR